MKETISDRRARIPRRRAVWTWSCALCALWAVAAAQPTTAQPVSDAPQPAVAAPDGAVVAPAATSGPCTQASIALTLTWDDLGRDLELHLVRPGGRINDDASDCTWTSCISRSPDWGVAGDPRDDPAKDADVTGAFGPEHICLSAPEPGRYTVLVEHWSSAGSPLADGLVELAVSGRVEVSEVADLPPHHV